MRPGDRDLIVRQQRFDPGWGTGDGAGHGQRQATHVGWVQAVDVLVGVKFEQGGLEVDVLRRRVLEEDRVDSVLIIEPVDGIEDVLLCAVRWQAYFDGVTAELGRFGVLHADVTGTRVVVTNEQRREPRKMTRGAKRVDARTQASGYGIRDRTTGHHQRARHRFPRLLRNSYANSRWGAWNSWSPGTTWTRT